MPDDIEQIRKAEERRGRRPQDTETLAERRRRQAALRAIVEHGTEGDLKALMRELGLSPESVEWKETLQIWNAEREQT